MSEELFEHRSLLPVEPTVAFAWHERFGAFERLTPAWEQARLIAEQGTIHDGDWKTIEIRKGPFRRRWTAVHDGYEAGHRFADTQVNGPFAAWRHEHRFLPDPAGAELVDTVSYRLPFGPVGRVVGSRLARSELERLFAFRHRRLRHDLERHAMTDLKYRIAVTGSTGLIGDALCAFLTTGGHDVVRLVRHAPGPGEVVWDPAGGAIDASALEGVDAVVHLAGEPIGHRWTSKRKDAILRSRAEGTTLLATALAGLECKPATLVSVSAVGAYGSRGDEVLTERSARGGDFLAEVCRAWEESTGPATDAGIRVVTPRLGVVLEAILPRMLRPFRFGVGGRLGSGRQWLSWIALDDAVAALHQALIDDRLVGPVNATAPAPVTNRELTKVLGSVLRRPTVLPVPAVALGMVFGEMGRTTLLGSQRVRPEALESVGFRFAYPDLESALRHALGR